ncbi:ParB N-terminal domain-containing protein [Bathymodiolus platifrons methanotrophic gill symbiont]|uniref:ParB N-terminal domain-containing protein n=1 Tax=Bathymodiolus platifrons methanotrophic gill symbiont TaxID=113268 RepID=UPI001C8D950B|nr:ParB N-terminal domain-containing protein [Bathymodiolus platifrons methanotrophic gill symbiont]
MNPKNLIPTQTRNEISGSQVKRLTKDVKKNGFDQTKPVDVARNQNGRLEILDGHHRAGSRYFCESLFWASQPKQAAKT